MHNSSVIFVVAVAGGRGGVDIQDMTNYLLLVSFTGESYCAFSLCNAVVAVQRPDENSYRGNVKKPRAFLHVYLLAMHNLRNLKKMIEFC